MQGYVMDPDRPGLDRLDRTTTWDSCGDSTDNQGQDKGKHSHERLVDSSNTPVGLRDSW